MSNPIYDIDFSKTSVQLLPPDKRFKKQVAWINVLMSPLQWLRNLWFGDYINGAVYSDWNNVSTYSKYDRVKYNKSIYESLVDDNTNNNPTDANYWFQVQVNFIGVSERVNYNGQKLVLEFALNKWFGTTFRQPPLVSDIYINNADVIPGVFVVGGVEAISSSVFRTGSSEVVIDGYTFAAQPNFNIYVPIAVYNALDTGMINNEKIFRNFADKYIPAGLIYSIITY